MKGLYVGAKWNALILTSIFEYFKNAVFSKYDIDSFLRENIVKSVKFISTSPEGMVIKVGINGFGRVGRVIFRTCCENPEIQITAINDPAIELEYICYLIKYDSTHGKYKGNISYEGDEIKINNNSIKVFHHKAPQDIPWQKAGVQCVVEASGMFTTLEKASGHLAGESVRRVLVTAPSADVPMLILGVNEAMIRPDLKVISCASSTLYCLAPIVKLLQDAFGVAEGFVTSIHAMTPSLKPLDGLCIRGNHWRDHRSIHQNIIPAATGACKALSRIIPGVRDKLTGLAFRVPIVNVSVLDLSIRLIKCTSLTEVVQRVQNFQNRMSYKIIQLSKEQAVSSDFIGDEHSCTLDVDSSLELRPNFFKLICWYENEYSYACRVVDTILYLERQQHILIVPPFTQGVGLTHKSTFLKIEDEQEKRFKKHVAVDCVSFPFLLCEPYSARATKTLTRTILNRPTSAYAPDGKPKLQSLDTQRRTVAMKTCIDNLIKSTFVQNKIGFHNNDKTPQKQNQKECINPQEPLKLPKNKFSKTVNNTEGLHKQSNVKKMEPFLVLKGPSKDLSERELYSPVAENCKHLCAADTSGQNNEDQRNNIIIEVCGDIKTCKLSDNTCSRGVTGSQKIGDGSLNKTSHTLATSKSSQTGNANAFEKAAKSFENKSIFCESLENNGSKDKTQPLNIKDCKIQVTKAVDNSTQSLGKNVTSCDSKIPISKLCNNGSKDKTTPMNVKEDCKVQVTKAIDNLTQDLSKNVSSDFFDEGTTDEVIHIIGDNQECETEQNNTNINESRTARECIDVTNIETNKCNDADMDESVKLSNKDFSNMELVDEKLKQRNIVLVQYVMETDKFLDKEGIEAVAPSDFQEDEQARTGWLQPLPSEPLMIMAEESSACGSPVRTITTISNGETYTSKQDIYDKLDSASVSGSENSFQIYEKKSQILNLTDLSYSLEDLSRLDKICRIIEISDELSDKLFAPLENKISGEICKQKWSFKDLCQKIKLDEFCNNIFGKSAS